MAIFDVSEKAYRKNRTADLQAGFWFPDPETEPWTPDPKTGTRTPCHQTRP